MNTQLTNKHTLIRSIINEALTGDDTALKGLVHYLHDDLHYPLYRIAGAAFRLYNIPIGVIYTHLTSIR